jgi:methionyl-tRNA formyltransferase
MKVAFFGTPEFAIPSLAALIASHHKVAGVVSAPDKPRGRGREVIPAPVTQFADENGLNVLTPLELEDEEFLSDLKDWNADAFAIVAFRILPEEVFGIPKFGTINLHASLLPKYRGAAPIQWAIWNGEKETGLTTFQIQEQVDTGNILKQEKVEIGSEDDAGSLSSKLAKSGAKLLVETLNELESGKLMPRQQDDTGATRAPKIKKEHTVIDWKQPAERIHNQVRALAPSPGAMTQFQGKTLKIYRTTIAEKGQGLKPEELLIDDAGICAGTDSGELHIIELQLQDKKRMDAVTFLRGFRQRGSFRMGA